MKTKITTKRAAERQVARKIKKGDSVMAIAGNYKGQTGTVLSLRGDRAIVQGLNVRKKHVRRSQSMPQGAVLELEGPIHISNLMLCLDGGQPVKVKVKIDESGERSLYYKQGDVEVIYRSLKKQNT